MRVSLKRLPVFLLAGVILAACGGTTQHRAVQRNAPVCAGPLREISVINAPGFHNELSRCLDARWKHASKRVTSVDCARLGVASADCVVNTSDHESPPPILDVAITGGAIYSARWLGITPRGG